MDERFPVLRCTEEDDPDRYDNEDPVSFSDAQKTVAAVEKL